MAIKLDIFKAYENLEWHFLETMMRKLGFEEGWVSKVMTCVSTMSYAVLTNGQPSQVINPTKGLCQGDPISPYFISYVQNFLIHFLMILKTTQELRGLRWQEIVPL